MTNFIYKWDKLEHLPQSVGYEEFEKYLQRYMKTNNFTLNEIRYILGVLDNFYFLSETYQIKMRKNDYGMA